SGCCSRTCCGRLLFLCLVTCSVAFLFFFFQAEDGIRDWSVTGVQTCALPISATSSRTPPIVTRRLARPGLGSHMVACCGRLHREIGRASCRERGEISGGAVSLKKKRVRRERGYAVSRMGWCGTRRAGKATGQG